MQKRQLRGALMGLGVALGFSLLLSVIQNVGLWIIGVLLVQVAIIAVMILVVIDSKKRWPALPWYERLVNILTFTR